MTPEEKTAFIQMEKDIAGLVQTQNSNSQKLDEVLKAIKGDEFGNAGLVGRVASLESDMRLQKENKAITSVYVKIIIWLLAVISTGVVGFILNVILKTKN